MTAIDLARDCGHDCGCPSRLHHDLSALVARILAPVPPPSRSWIATELQRLLDEDTDRADDR